MIISHKHKFIYFKAQKVAGTSTEILLDTFCGKDDIVTPITPGDSDVHCPRNFGVFRNHVSSITVKNHIGADIFNSYYKFMNIRNPWERVISFYFFHKRKMPPFDEWVKQKNSLTVLHPLEYWSHIGNELILDNYIRYDKLEDDTKTVLKKIGIQYGEINYPRAKTGLRPHKKHYGEYYNEETRELVRKKYIKDIENFGYDF